jgi:hypothetical protein
MTPRRITTLLALLVAVFIVPARAVVVVNEIFYNAPEDLDELQWVELHNTADQPVDLGGWSMKKALKYTFPQGTTIPPKGFIVVARKPERFKEFYHDTALGPFEKLSKSGGRIDLLDAGGKVVDVAQYKDRAPWPISADGYSASLERICPTAPGDSPDNWAGSPLPTSAPRPGGTPGKPNAAYSAEVPPTVASVTLNPDDPAPDQPLKVRAEVKAKDGVKDVTLVYRVVVRSVEGAELTVPMTADPAAAAGTYVAEIPAQKAGTIVRYHVKATGANGAERSSPATNDLRPNFSAFVHDKWETAPIPFGQIFNVRPPKVSGLARLFGGREDGAPQARGRGSAPVPRPPRGSGAVVWVDPTSGKTTLFDYINIPPRDGGRGYKVHFHKDHTLSGMSVVSIIFEGNERFLLAEAMAYDVYRRAGNAAPLTDFVRLWVDGRPVGYHLLIENPNRSFLRRNKVNDGGNLYKIVWYGGSLVGTHEKRTNRHTGGHEDLIKLVDQLRKTTGDAQWKVIQDNFDVQQVATYFAVNMVLDHWDGYFNNYFTYHDPKTGKWQMYPWDQDKTWGYYDGIPPGQVFTELPLTFGMEGARPPQGQGGGPFGGGGLNWWRDGGVFSKPLLANPHFRRVFLTRLKDILDNVYTQQVYFPLLNQTADRLKEDVKIRAKVAGGDASGAQLAENVQLLKTHLEKRREFLLAQPELKALATTRPQ